MPARLSSMELSPVSSPIAEQSTRPSRRKSGRAVHAPERLVASSAPKRKRDEDEDVEDEDDDEDMDDVLGEEEDEPAAEEIQDKQRKARRTGGGRATAPKRVKTTATSKLATRPKGKTKIIRKGAKLVAAEDAGGLYGKLKPQITCNEVSHSDKR